MLQDPNVERYVEQAMKPVLKQIKELQAEFELLKKALHKTDCSTSVCPKCKSSNIALNVAGTRYRCIYCGDEGQIA